MSTDPKYCEKHEELKPPLYRTMVQTNEYVKWDTLAGLTCNPRREYEEQITLRKDRIRNMEQEISELQDLRDHEHDWQQGDLCAF